MKSTRKKYKHTGTDCSHTMKGMCDRCKIPMAVRLPRKKKHKK